MGDEEAKRKADEEAAKKATDDEAAKRASGTIASALLNAALSGGGEDESDASGRLARVQLELSEEADIAEMEELKLRQAAKSRKRKIIQKAIDEGIDAARLSEHLASLNVSGSPKPPD